MEIVYLDGQYIAACEAKVSVFDRGFLFADSVYEVIPFYQGKGFQLTQHLERLGTSLNAINIQCNIPFVEIINKLVEKNGGGNLSVYLQVTRGAGVRRTHAIDEAMKPTIFACCSAIKNNYNSDIEQVLPVKVVVVPDLRWQRCDIKSTSLLPNILAMQTAAGESAQESLLEKDGYILEGASSNFFIVKDGTLIAPQSSHKILKGTTSQLVQRIAKASGVSFIHASITYQQLINADEVWIASSTRGLLPVTQVDHHTISDGVKGDLWCHLYKLLAEHQDALFDKTD